MRRIFGSSSTIRTLATTYSVVESLLRAGIPSAGVSRTSARSFVVKRCPSEILSISTAIASRAIATALPRPISLIEADNLRHEHEWRVWEETKLQEGRILIPGVVSYATNVVEHPELVAERIVRFANVVGRENVIAGTDCGLGGRLHRQLVWAKLKSLSEGARLATKQLWDKP